MRSANIRCADNEVGAVEAFYCDHLGFRLDQSQANSVLSNGTLNLRLNGDSSENEGELDCARSFQNKEEALRLEFDDLDRAVFALKERGTEFCSELIHDEAGARIYLRDPSGYLLELAQRTLACRSKPRVRGVYCVAARARRAGR